MFPNLCHLLASRNKKIILHKKNKKAARQCFRSIGRDILTHLPFFAQRSETHHRLAVPVPGGSPFEKTAKSGLL
jgi:hypothetical protein